MRACHTLTFHRLGWAKSKVPGLETLDYTKLSKGQSVVSKLHELVLMSACWRIREKLVALSRSDGLPGDGHERDGQ